MRQIRSKLRRRQHWERRGVDSHVRERRAPTAGGTHLRQNEIHAEVVVVHPDDGHLGAELLRAKVTVGVAVDGYGNAMIVSWLVSESESTLPIGRDVDILSEAGALVDVPGKVRDGNAAGEFSLETAKLLLRVVVSERLDADDTPVLLRNSKTSWRRSMFSLRSLVDSAKASSRCFSA